MATYKALNPRGEVAESLKVIGLNPRVTDLNNVTLGLFATHKGHWMSILEEVGKQLQERYPGLKLSKFRYLEDLNSYNQCNEVGLDERHLDDFKEFLSGVDTVLVGNGDAGSCTLYCTYNTTWVEKLGKPAVLLTQDLFLDILKTAAKFKRVPTLRYVTNNIGDLSYMTIPDKAAYIRDVLPGQVSPMIDNVIERLTTPLTPEEADPIDDEVKLPRIVVEGSFEDVNKYFYQQYWSYGMPIVPPTEEAVKMMLEGTDLPPDHVVALIPPKRTQATVEKIAINAVMAGCLPTHLPVVIAAVEALVDPLVWSEAFTISVASWAPMFVVNGPVRHDIDISYGVGVFSPYNRANAAIAHAVGLIVMNLGSVRRGFEDRGMFGHEGHFGFMIGENEEASPWEPWHVFKGFDKEDSTVTLTFPNSRELLLCDNEPGNIFRYICERVPYMGFDPGCSFVLCPAAARVLNDAGYGRTDFTAYIMEYARRPAREINSGWMKDNCHVMPGMILPESPDVTVKKFFSDIHMPAFVSGMDYGNAILLYGGGGDHGRPTIAKANFPKNWNKLVAQYKDFSRLAESK